ncbi:MAG: hypothetical protein KF862_08410 [Chitinophagaceae bacterium]|nr:hypothetical protein [Chitinophagaceae bacterium]
MILGQSVTPCEGEVSIKSYQCTQFNSKVFGIKANGFLEVTNKRLLFQALGKDISSWSVIHSEVAVADVSEIKIYKGSSFNILLLIIGIILSLFAASVIKAILSFTMNSGGLGTFISFAILVGGIYWFYTKCRKEAFSLVVQTKGGSGKVVSIAGLSPFGEGGSVASKALQAEPGPDSELLFKEIGAVVSDIQNLGENAIEKWKK